MNLRLPSPSSALGCTLALALTTVALGCGDVRENKAPILDSVNAPLRVTEENGAYAIPVTLLFHDNDGEAITHLHYRLPPNVEGVIDVPAPNPARESAELTIVVRAADLDGDETAPASTDADGDEHGGAPHGARPAEHGRDRSRAQALELSVVDYRGAESVPQSSSLTLD
jgi:hypothetical protein